MVNETPSAPPALRAATSVARAAVRLLVWAAVVVAFLSTLLSALLSGQDGTPPDQTFSALMMVALSIFAICSLVREDQPDRKSWIAANAVVVAVAMVAWSVLPQWSGLIVAVAFLPLIAVPHGLGLLSDRCAIAGRRRAMAFFLRLASCLHPSREMRFRAAFAAAYALGPIDEKIAAYGALARTATPEQTVFLDIWIALARDDWAGVLARLQGAPSLQWLAIFALGELGRLDEMVSAYTLAQRRLDRTRLLLSRLYVLAFSGRRDGVCALLRGKLRFLTAELKAFWTNDGPARGSITTPSSASERSPKASRIGVSA